MDCSLICMLLAHDDMGRYALHCRDGQVSFDAKGLKYVARVGDCAGFGIRIVETQEYATRILLKVKVQYFSNMPTSYSTFKAQWRPYVPPDLT